MFLLLFIQEDLEDVEVTKKRKTKVTRKEEDEFHLLWELMSTSVLFQSRVGEEQLQEMKCMYKVPKSVRWRIPRGSDRPCYVKEGRVALYIDAMHIGLRFPMQPYFCKVLCASGLVPA